MAPIFFEVFMEPELYILIAVVFSVSLISYIIIRAISEDAKESPIELKLTPYELLQRQMYIKAIRGDNNARDWVMKYVFEKTPKQEKKNHTGDHTNRPKKPVSKPAEAPKPTTNEAIINDAVSGLVALGTKKTDAKKIIKTLTTNKKYLSCEELIKDVFKRQGTNNKSSS